MHHQAPATKTTRTLIGILALASVLHAQAEPQHCTYQNFATFAIEFDGWRPTLHGSINNQPIVALVDTGSYGTKLTSTAAENLHLQLRHLEHAKVAGMGGESEQFFTEVNDFSLGEEHWHHQWLPVIRDSTHKLPWDALIGADMLYVRDLEISLKDKYVKFFEGDKHCDAAFLAYWDKDAQTIPTETVSIDDDRQMFTVEINGKPVRAILDSGAPTSVLDLAAAKRAGVTPQSDGVVEIDKAGGIGKHETRAWLAPFDSFAIGGEMVKHTKIEIADMADGLKQDRNFEAARMMASDGPEMLLGADFLRTHRVLFAVSQHQLYFSYLGGRPFDRTYIISTAEEAKTP